MTYTDLFNKILALPPEEMEKGAKKLSDYAACWNGALEFAMNNIEGAANFPNWYAEHEKELH